MTGKPILSTIPKQLHVDIWQKWEYGSTVPAINEYLQAQGIFVHDRTIYRLIKQYREDKQEITKAIYANEVLSKAHSDLSTVDEMINSLYANYQERLDNDDHKYAIMYAQSLEKYLSFRRNLMLGDTTMNEAPKTPLIEQLLEKLSHVSNSQITEKSEEVALLPAATIPSKPDTN